MKTPIKQEHQQELLEHLRRGRTYPQLAAWYGYTYNQIRQWAIRNKCFSQYRNRATTQQTPLDRYEPPAEWDIEEDVKTRTVPEDYWTELKLNY